MRAERAPPAPAPKKQHYRQKLLVIAFVFAGAFSSCIVLFEYLPKSITWASTLLTENIAVHHPKHHHHEYVADTSEKTPPFAATFSPEMTTNVTLEVESGPYHDWELFSADFQEMMQQMKVFVYPDVFNDSSINNINPFGNIFIPHPDPFHDPKRRNYFSEHMFKIALLRSSLLTANPEEAHFFFLPFSINNLRNDPRIRSETSISKFVAEYASSINRHFKFWNASGGASHFYVSCHSVGREAASKYPELHNNAIQITCSSSYFQRFYVSHKDVGLPQVWPRPHQMSLNPPHARHKLVFFAGRRQNSQARLELIKLWGNDSDMDIYYRRPSFPYEEGFRRSKYCLHVKGYEVNTARVCDAIHYGCIPVIISNYYDLPFSNVLDWSKFSVIINQGDIGLLKKRLLAITTPTYLSMYYHLCKVRRHFVWHTIPRGYDSFYMTAYQLWLKRRII